MSLSIFLFIYFLLVLGIPVFFFFFFFRSEVPIGGLLSTCDPFQTNKPTDPPACLDKSPNIRISDRMSEYPNVRIS